LCALFCSIITYYGLKAFKEKLAKISSGSIMKNPNLNISASTSPSVSNSYTDLRRDQQKLIDHAETQE
jgi:hypothetical protein